MGPEKSLLKRKMK